MLVVVTGGSGNVASMVRPHLRERGWYVRLLDTRPPAAELGPGESFVPGSILDDAALDTAMRADGGSVDLVVHLAAHAGERSWEDILEVNVDGTRRVLEAALRAGVRRVLVASSVHAVGYTPLGAVLDADLAPVRPDTYYGFSKAAGEALAGLYADRYGMSIVSARIVIAVPAPWNPLSRIGWLSGADAARLVEASARLEEPGHHVVWGVSRAGGRWFPLEAGRRIGFDPVDSAELPGDGDGPFEPLAGFDFPRIPLGG